MDFGQRIRFVSWLALVLAAFLGLAHCVNDEGTPVVVTDGGTIVGEASVVDNRFSVSGTVDGLPATATVALTLNGANALTAKNGAFSFPPVLLSEQTYVVAAGSTTQGFSCAVANGSGTIANANVTNVVVHCTSADATLSALSISSSPLVPAFTPKTLSYSASSRLAGFFGTPVAQTTTVTATPNDPGATITVNGTPVKAGVASSALAVKEGVNSIDVVVTASDKKAQQHYVISATGMVNDYLKPSNTGTNWNFGFSVALSGDGNTLAVGARTEPSGASGINGNQADTSATHAGAVYVFRRAGAVWTQEAYIKASNSKAFILFGESVALSYDGNTLAVGAMREASAATGIGGNQADTSATNAGAAYVFTRAGTTWSQQAYIKASNARADALFGASVALSSDGNTLAVGASGDSSNATGIGGNQADTSAASAGAAYVFTRAGATWSQQAYVKASNTRAQALFGGAIALSSDGNTLAVGATGESSNATGIGGNDADTSLTNAGAVFVFTRAGTTWSQQAYVKASNTAAFEFFGSSVALSSDGNTLAAGAIQDSSDATGINGNDKDTSTTGAGAAWVFSRAGTVWSQQAYVKPSNTTVAQYFGYALALSADGNRLAVSAIQEASAATGINGNDKDTSATSAGAAYVFSRAAAVWSQLAYVKASNTRLSLTFGTSIAISPDGKTVAVGAQNDASGAKGVNGDESDTSVSSAGAVYLY